MHRLALTTLAIAAISTGGSQAQTTTPAADVRDLVRAYSTQLIIELNVGETYAFKLKTGEPRVIKLISVQEHRDSVVNLMRSAEVRLEIDGKPLELDCQPYVLPTAVAGLRIQADTTAGWGKTSKSVQLSVWDAKDPIVDTSRFGPPFRSYRLLSHGTQAYGEPVHLGAGDDDPQGQCFYHDYGFDQAGFEGREEVTSATDGTIALFWPSREDLCSVVVKDPAGFFWEYGHLASVFPETVLDARVVKGQKLGCLGRSGPSGNFSHLHLGSYLTRADLDADQRTTRLNLYPWLVAAYRAQHPEALLAVARPHHLVRAGEEVTFDGKYSIIPAGRRIVEWRWVFHDAQESRAVRAEKAYDRPGAYVAALWIKDEQGDEDVDFCQVKVYSKASPEKAMPHIFMTYTPTLGIAPKQPVNFRFWLQGGVDVPIAVDFGDGTRLADYRSYSEVQHGFDAAGVHVVSARCEFEGKPIEQKLKVVVEPLPRAK